MTLDDVERADFVSRLATMSLSHGVCHGLLAISKAMYPTNRERFEHEFGHGNDSHKRDVLLAVCSNPIDWGVDDDSPSAGICPRCYSKLKLSYRFCPGCGKRLDHVQS